MSRPAFDFSQGMIDSGWRGVHLARVDECLYMSGSSAETQMAILNALPAHVALVDEHGVILTVNDAWRRFASANQLQGPEFCVGMNYLDVCERATGDCAVEAREAGAGIRGVLRGGLKKFSVEYPCHTPAEKRWFRLMVTPLREDQNAGAVIMHVDVTGRKVTELTLKRTLERLSEAQRIGCIGDWEWEIDSQRINWSPQVFEIFGRDPLLGPPRNYKQQQHLFETSSWAIMRDRVAAAVTSGDPQAYELVVLRPDGARVNVHAVAVPRKDATGRVTGLYGTIQNITERKKLENQLLRTQRLESLGTLAGGIAHDLNNVLTPVIMSLDLLRSRFGDPASQELIEIIATSARRGADMVGQVLTYARGVEGRRTQVEIADLIGEIGRIANDTFLKHIQVHAESPAGLWPVEGDPTQLHQVLLNLCVNARDAMPDGGLLTLAAENLVLDAHYAGMNPQAMAAPYVRIRVEDAGNGIPPDVLENIFDPFFTTKEFGKGTGLGLATSLSIVKSHGGFIQVYSEVGAGTRFHVYLPARTARQASEPAPAKEGPRYGNGELILVVDDEDAVLRITRHTLESAGYRVLLAADGAEAVAAYAARHGEIAAVLTDMMMPVMDGPATIQVLLRINPAVRVLAASGLSASGHLARANAMGVNHFLPKPYTAEALLASLGDLLAGNP